MSFWDDLKDIFKSDEDKDDEQKRKLGEARQGESELEKKLAEMDAQFKSKKQKQTFDVDAIFPSDSGLKEVEYTPRTDEDIISSADKEIDYLKTKDKNKVEKDFASAVNALDESKRNADKTLKERYKDLENVYNELRQRAENDAIKRGVARSSIALSKLSDLDAARMESTGKVESAYQDTIGNIDAKIKELENDRDVALSELDLKYADELAKRISNLKAERDDAVLAYEKYNNSIREKQTKYAIQRQENIDKFLKEKEAEAQAAEKKQEAYEKTHGYQGEKLKEYQNRYNLAYDFYMSLSPDIAVNALQTATSMKYYLGNYYDKLLAALKSRVTNVSGSRRTYF